MYGRFLISESTFIYEYQSGLWCWGSEASFDVLFVVAFSGPAGAIKITYKAITDCIDVKLETG